jgi:cytochrome c biogenesis protein CcmG/thiol:disulfide interchange protein DsbE
MQRVIKRFARLAAASATVLLLAALLGGCEKEQIWKTGKKAPDISVLDLNEKTVKLSDFKGQVVVLRFWATGCKACVAGMPVLDEYSKPYRDKGLTVLAINMANSKPMVEAFAKGLKLSYPVFQDPALIAAKKYGVRAVPSTYIIDRKGIARSFAVGEITKEKFDETISGLL